MPKNPINPRYEDVPDFKQDYVWKAGESQEDDNSGMWIMADTFCLARKGEFLHVRWIEKAETEPAFLKVNSNSFQIIGVCPQPAYTGPLLPNPYRMAIDGKASVPLKYSDSAAGSGALAAKFDNTIGDSSLDLLPAKEYWLSVDKASTIADLGLKESWKTPIGGNDNSVVDGIVFRRHPKNWKKKWEENDTDFNIGAG